MNLYFKFFILILKRIFCRENQTVEDICVSKFTVGFWDLDLNFHMNNGRFFSVMDLGRLDLLIRTGHFVKLFSSGYYPVAFSESIVFKRPLNYLNRYEVHTKIDSWDDKFFYMTQKFYYRSNIVASANVRACFKKRGRKGIVTPKDLFSIIGEHPVEIPLSGIAQKQKELDGELLPRG